MNSNYTAAEKVLLSSYEISKDKVEFSAEELTVKCWEKFPNDFALKGYENFPNSNAVLLHLMNKNGALLKNGWISKKKAKIYKITDTGLSYVKNFLLNDVTLNKKSTNKVDLPRDMMINIKSFLSIRVVQEILNGKDFKQLKFVSACSFWKISSSMTYPEIITELNNVTTWIDTLSKIFKNHKEDFIKIENNSVIKKNSVTLLRNAHKFFLDKFKNDLDLIKKIRPNASRN